MPSRFHVVSTLALLGLAVALVAGPAAAAGGKAITPSKEALTLNEGGDPITPQAVLVSTGFEAGEGFALGPLEPQNGYTASGVNLPFASISTINPFAGAQHLRIIRDATVGSGSQRVMLSPPLVVAPNSPSQLRQMIYISNDGGADYDVIGQAPSQALLAWRVKFSWTDGVGTGPGTIFILDNPGAVLQFVDTGVLWTEGAYRELKVQFDPGAGEIRYFYNGVQIYTGGIFGANVVEQFGWVDDNFQLAGEHAGIDALQLLDTPSDPVPVQSTTWGRIKGDYR